MKLNVLPASAGAQWVRVSIRTFWRQSLALGTVFILQLAALMFLSLFIPIIGYIVALILKPAFTVGMMAATREAEGGKPPRPFLLFTALRQGAARTRAMIALGLLYAAAVMVVMGVFMLIGDEPLKAVMTFMVNNPRPSPDQIETQIAPALLDPRLNLAALVAMTLYALAGLVFWHAPALMHWHGVPVVKSLFFSTVAVLRNARAFLLYGLLWLCLGMGAMSVLMLLAALGGSVGLIVGGALQFPLALIIWAMFAASQWFTFRDSFVPDAPPPEAASTAG
jgi:hypothetical protein